jgi:hypothetical protein
LQPDKLAPSQKSMYGTPIHSKSYAASKVFTPKVLDAYRLISPSVKD